jgi:predicted HTH transcriptional regulator
MRDQMLNHGLEQPLISTDTGYFQVTFTGPGDNLDRIRVPEAQLQVTLAVEAGLSERQRKILAHVLETGSVTTRWCVETLGVARDTAYRELAGLVELGLLSRKGAGRSAAYMLKAGKSG